MNAKPAAAPKKSPRKPAATKAESKATPAKPAPAKSEKEKPRPEKLSAIDAAAKVLASAKEPLSTKQLIEAMAQQKLWSSPSGLTPQRTLYSAILREMNAKGKDARFQKKERGKFAAKA
jgi:hypothetical protein